LYVIRFLLFEGEGDRGFSNGRAAPATNGSVGNNGISTGTPRRSLTIEVRGASLCSRHHGTVIDFRVNRDTSSVGFLDERPAGIRTDSSAPNARRDRASVAPQVGITSKPESESAARTAGESLGDGFSSL
jgi:hypothetical protein